MSNQVGFFNCDSIANIIGHTTVKGILHVRYWFKHSGPEKVYEMPTKEFDGNTFSLAKS